MNELLATLYSSLLCRFEIDRDAPAYRSVTCSRRVYLLVEPRLGSTPLAFPMTHIYRECSAVFVCRHCGVRRRQNIDSVPLEVVVEP